MTLSQMKSVWGEDEYLYYEKLYAAVVETAGSAFIMAMSLRHRFFIRLAPG